MDESFRHYENANGWTCQACDAWVWSGCAHTCPATESPSLQLPPSPQERIAAALERIAAALERR